MSLVLDIVDTLNKLDSGHSLQDKAVHIWYRGYICEYVDSATADKFKEDYGNVDQYLMDKFNLPLVRTEKFKISGDE